MLHRPAALVCTTLAASLLIACGGGSGGSKTATPAARPTAARSAAGTPSGSPASTLGIRTLDLTTVPGVQKLIADNGGSIVPSEVIYQDLTGDNEDEAVVPISSGGTLGDVAFIVLQAKSSGAKTLLSEAPGGGLAVSIEDGKLVMTQSVPGVDDPNCCPSNLRKTVYRWDGARLVVESEQTVPNLDDGNKATPSVPQSDLPPIAGATSSSSRPPAGEAAAAARAVPKPPGPRGP